VYSAGDTINVRFKLTNTGERAGQEVVQLYVRDPEASVARPLKELKAFKKVSLEPGETTTVEFSLDERALAYWDRSVSDWVAEPGEFEILIGASSRDIRTPRPNSSWKLKALPDLSARKQRPHGPV